MQRGLRGLSGQPVRPYTEISVNSGQTLYLDLIFLDALRNPAIPVSFTWRVDNLSTATTVQDYTLVTLLTSQNYLLVLPGNLNIISSSTGIGLTSQINQILVTATYIDGSVAVQPFAYEVIAMQTVGGM